MKPNKHIERRIIIGLIVSESYISQVKKFWDIQVLQSSMAQSIATWCIEYHDKYNKAPNRNIESIYIQKLKDGKLNPDDAEELEQDILPGLSEEYDRELFNTQYLMDQTKAYFRERQLTIYTDQIQTMVKKGDLSDAETLALNFKPISDGVQKDVELSSPEALTRIENAFLMSEKPIITYPGAFGRFINSQLVRGGFIGFLGMEKVGKTWILMELSIHACKGGANVAFFQAGDMTEEQQLRRIAISIAGKSDKQKYCKNIKIPVLDCGRNFSDNCERPERKSKNCINEKIDPYQVFSTLKKMCENQDALKELLEKFQDYTPCGLEKCQDFVGSVWFKKVADDSPLTVEQAQASVKSFFKPIGKIIKKRRGRYKLSTYYNGTLSIQEIRSCLDKWEKEDNFIPDVIIIDYMDLLIDHHKDEYRHRQNELWKGGRLISQERHALVITATQANAGSYNTDLLELSNYSEDKRKYSHVTAMYGLNRDKKGVEKKMGITRINELLIRDGASSVGKQICVLQALQKGKAFLGSFVDRTPNNMKGK